ncbi:MAG TPA: hypothetical protein VFB62_00980 [Polyangiaceae bacterium]|nr:hypothetical protein [Polyangiaceae bacterium]
MLVACPHCSVHVKVTERRCPHCGEALRRADGSIARTAGAIVLGIVAAGCGGEETRNMPAYGVPDVSAQSTTAQTSASTGSSGGSSQGGSPQGGASQGGAGGMGGSGGSGGDLAMPAYGVGAMGNQ